MTREEIAYIVSPFLVTVAIILIHYRILVSQNPAAYGRPRLPVSQTLEESELTPNKPTAAFPRELRGEMASIPMSKAKLKELLTALRSQNANTLMLEIGMTISADGNLILTQAAESSEETLLKWAKKTVADAHAAGFHTYIAFRLLGAPVISDPARFSQELKEILSRWGNMAQEYHISLLNPGISLGSPSFSSLPPENLKLFLTEVEHTIRETYTGRIGLEVCCQPAQLMVRGYNQLLLVAQGQVPAAILEKAKRDAGVFGIEHIYALDLTTRKLSTLR